MSHQYRTFVSRPARGALGALETFMNQAALDLPIRSADVQADPLLRAGFDIGWDHAHHGLVPPAELLLAGTPVCQGWMAGRAVFGRRTLGTARQTRQWLALRLLAWRQGIRFEVLEVTPNYLSQLHVARCPVLRVPLAGTSNQPEGSSVERLNSAAGYAAGNLVVMSRAAALAAQGISVEQAVRQACLLEGGAEFANGLNAAAWWRLACLLSFARPMPFAEAARLPLAVLPPNRVRLLNAPQGLQALVTRCFMAPGWAARCQALAQCLPAHSLRLDFNLFVGAIAPRVLEAGADPQALKLALEDAWLQERVQRRWTHFVLSLGQGGTDALLERALHKQLAGVRTVQHAAEQALEGWALADGGRVLPVAHTSRRPPPPLARPSITVSSALC